MPAPRAHRGSPVCRKSLPEILPVSQPTSFPEPPFRPAMPAGSQAARFDQAGVPCFDSISSGNGFVASPA